MQNKKMVEDEHVFPRTDRLVWHEILLAEQPLFGLGLGMIGALAADTLAKGACLAGAAFFTLVLSSVVLSLFWRTLSEKKRLSLLVHFVIFSVFDTGITTLISFLWPSIGQSLEVFLPINCFSMVLLSGWERAKVYPIGKESIDSTVIGISYAIAVLLFSAIREGLGHGTLAGFKLFEQAPFKIAADPMGGFILLGVAMAGWSAFNASLSARKGGKSNE